MLKHRCSRSCSLDTEKSHLPSLLVVALYIILVQYENRDTDMMLSAYFLRITSLFTCVLCLCIIKTKFYHISFAVITIVNIYNCSLTTYTHTHTSLGHPSIVISILTSGFKRHILFKKCIISKCVGIFPEGISALCECLVPAWEAGKGYSII